MQFLKTNTLFLFFSLLTLLFSSCQKPEDFEDLDLLLNKDWKLVKVTEGTSDITKACDLDDVLTFTDTKDYEYNFGESFCDEAFETSSESRGWEFKKDFTQIILSSKQKNARSFSVFFFRWDIVELTENTLILRDSGAEENDILPIVKEYNL